MLYYVKKYTPILLIIVICIVLYYYLQDRDEIVDEEHHDNDIDFLAEEHVEEQLLNNETNEVQNNLVIVDIKGAVVKPGVYELEANSRIHHLIDMAGGYTDDANEQHINLAEKVYDEMVIYVPTLDEENLPLTVAANGSSSQTNGIRVNTASIDELTQLNGIGPAKAEAIITHREENGPFTTVDDLLDVNGIGEKTLENIREQIIVP